MSTILVSYSGRNNVVHHNIAQHTRFNLNFFRKLLQLNLNPSLHFSLRHHTAFDQHFFGLQALGILQELTQAH
jgi:hypothetical protein